MPNFLLTPQFWFGLFGAGFALFTWFHKLNNDKFRANEERLEKIIKRIVDVEDTDKTALPRFLSLEKDFSSLQNTVNVHHEQRIQGIVTHNENQYNMMMMKFESHDKDIREIKNCIDKLEQKFDKNTDKIMEKLEALSAKH